MPAFGPLKKKDSRRQKAPSCKEKLNFPNLLQGVFRWVTSQGFPAESR